MSSWIVLKARAGRLLGYGLALAGFVQALLFTCRSLVSRAIPDPLADALPQHLALVVALLGVALIALGGLIARRQARTLETQKNRREDARRRVQHYRGSTRIEPTFEPVNPSVEHMDKAA